MSLSHPVGATLGIATATGTIVNDDSAPLLSILTAPPNFGNQVIGTSSAPHTVTVSNAGGSNLVLATPFAPLAPGDFAYASGANVCAAGQTLIPGATCNLYVVFTPSVLGNVTASVTLSSNAPDVTLVLVGMGVPAGSPVIGEPIPTLSQWAYGVLVVLILAIAGLRHRSAGRRGRTP